jgi:hypothetical protein
LAIKTFDTSGRGGRRGRAAARGAGQSRPGEIVDWVPEEFCVACAVEAQPDGTLPGPELYLVLLDWLRDQLRDLAGALLNRDEADGPQSERLELFPVPEDLLSRLANEPRDRREALRPLDRLQRPNRTPWLSFPRASQGVRSEATRLHFYAVPAVRSLTPQGAYRGGPPIDAVLGLTNLVNGHLLQDVDLDGRRITLTDDQARRDWRVRFRAVHPNWLSTGADDGDGGSPGSLPEPAPDGTWRFRALSRRLAARLIKADESRVLVAVLDTSPRKEELDAAAARYPGNWLLQVLSQESQPGGRLVVDRSQPSPLLLDDYYDPPFLSGLYPQMFLQRPEPDASQAHYLMPDHGLFVAGIVRSIAPFAEIRLIRVLNDFGLGDMYAVAKVLKQLPRLMTNGKDRLVVNLSLGADVPHPGDYLQLFHPSLYDQLGVTEGDLKQDAYGKLETLARPDSPVAAYAREALLLLRRTRLGLAEAVSWLSGADGAVATTGLRHRPLLVAAAGNDFNHLLALPRRDPRLPGGFNEVFSVAALNKNFEPSRFTNLGDERALRDGVATFGGDATRTVAEELPRIIGSDVGVVSVFSAADVPLPPKGTPPRPNASGWVEWSGTSFATPIISAVAARLWSLRPGLEPIDASPAAGWPGGGPPRTLAERILSFTPTGGYPPGPPLFAHPLHVEQTRW